jgi:copper homeostasis protein
VLTSGQKENALVGAAMLRQLVSHAAGRISILAGGGIRQQNLEQVVASSGVEEVHVSARQYPESTVYYNDAPVQFNSGLPEDWRCVLDTDLAALGALLKTAAQLK